MIFLIFNISLKALKTTLIKCRDKNLNAPSGCKNFDLAWVNKNVISSSMELMKVKMISWTIYMFMDY
jgi:hypothetical protein